MFEKDMYLKYNKGFLGMFEGFKPEFNYALFLKSFNFLKDMLVSAVLIFGVISLLTQLAPILILQIFIMIAVIYFRSFEDRMENILAIFNVIMYFLGILLFLLLEVVRGSFLRKLSPSIWDFQSSGSLC